MRTRGFILTVLLGSLVIVPPGHTVVYTLRPGTGQGSVLEALHARQALREPLAVNGCDGILEVATTELSLPDAVVSLKPFVGNYEIFRGGNAVLVEGLGKDGDLLRHYILSMGSRYRTLVFTMQLPRKALKATAESPWPDFLPKPQAEKIEMVVELTKRDAFYASLVYSENPGVAYRRYDALLRDAGWHAIASPSGNCCVYLHDKAKRLLAYSVIESDAGARGALFMARTDSVRQ